MKKAKVFKNGQSQAIMLPKDFRFSSNEVYVKKIGHSIILFPAEQPSWLEWEKSIDMFSDDFMVEHKQASVENRNIYINKE